MNTNELYSDFESLYRATIALRKNIEQVATKMAVADEISFEPAIEELTNVIDALYEVDQLISAAMGEAVAANVANEVYND